MNYDAEMSRCFLPVTTPKNEGIETLLPLRGTKTSAGYDFFTPIDLVIKPQDKVFFWTDVKAPMQMGEVLILDVRSSIGVKQDLMFANTLPIIDQDYCNNENNEGNIGICLRNLKPASELLGYTKINAQVHVEGYLDHFEIIDVPIVKDLREDNTVVIKAGERVAQGIFINFKQSSNCNTEAERSGGFGSSGK